MRTKSLVCAAVLAAGVVTSMAQVYSQNIVGYANVTVVPGYNMIANPFNNGSNGADVVLPATDGTSVLQWNGVGFNTFTYDSGFGGWIDGDYNSAIPTVAPGQGFFYATGSGATLTFTGNVAGNAGATVVNSVGVGYSMLGSKVPFSGAIDTLPINMPTMDGTSVLKWNGLGYNTVNFDSGFGGWIDGDYNNVPSPTVGIGEAFFYATGTGFNWYQTVPAN